MVPARPPTLLQDWAVGQGARRDAQAFADVLTESEQGLKGSRVGAVGERIQQRADFGRSIGWFSAHGWAKSTVRTPSGSSKRRVQDVSGQCHVAVPAAGSYLAVYRVPKPISNWSLRNGGRSIAATTLLSRRIVGAQPVQPRESPDAVESGGVGGVFDLIESVVGRRVAPAHDGGLLRGDENRGVIHRSCRPAPRCRTARRESAGAHRLPVRRWHRSPARSAARWGSQSLRQRRVGHRTSARSPARPRSSRPADPRACRSSRVPGDARSSWWKR